MISSHILRAISGVLVAAAVSKRLRGPSSVERYIGLSSTLLRGQAETESKDPLLCVPELKLTDSGLGGSWVRPVSNLLPTCPPVSSLPRMCWLKRSMTT